MFDLPLERYKEILEKLTTLEQRIRNLELTQEDLLNKVLRKIQRRDAATPSRPAAGQSYGTQKA
jgi:hypothetical protein